jgi:hypothetical protein
MLTFTHAYVRTDFPRTVLVGLGFPLPAFAQLEGGGNGLGDACEYGDLKEREREMCVCVCVCL